MKAGLRGFLFIILYCAISVPILAQVVLRDTTITWRHHAFELNEDYSIKSYSTSDSDIQEVVFTGGKVLENDLIRLVLLPEYGGRVLSFYYKPTGHEYLYQSECGSAYGIGEGNFYYNWLMVYGGIFPTFPEPEHGKTWLVPWDYSVLKETPDTVTVRMQYTDNSSYSGAPGRFNNGITQITCQVDISVYKGSSLWDFKVKLLNNQANTVNYEYWTCTTLAPGSNPGDTGTPLNSEMVIPVEEYFAGWSPGGWIGNFDSYYDFTRINYLSDWDDMGIAYAHDLNDVYWGVINHENEEGIFRVADNAVTFGTKLWTWGKNNIGNNMYDYSNGGADNYIELWAGTSRSFFTDAQLGANASKSWNEAYVPTIGLTGIDEMNEVAAVNLVYDEERAELQMQLNTFANDRSLYGKLYLDNAVDYLIHEGEITFDPLGQSAGFSLIDDEIQSGSQLLRYEIYENDELVLEHSEFIEISPVLSVAMEQANELQVRQLNAGRLLVQVPAYDDYNVRLISLNGQLVEEFSFAGSEIQLNVPQEGVYLIQLQGQQKSYVKKIYMN